MPVRSPRKLYLISQITVNLDDDSDATDPPGGTVRPVIAKIKEGIGDFLGLTALAWNDPIFTGTFGGSGLNQGAAFRRNLGGFRVASYTLISSSFFTIGERYYNEETGLLVVANKQFKSVSIGFPKGHSVNEIISWLAQTANFNQIAAIRTPAGRRIDINPSD